MIIAFTLSSITAVQNELFHLFHIEMKSDIIGQVIPAMRSKVSISSQTLGVSRNMRYFQLVIASQIIICYM